ncbi:MAG: hypothetical protein E4G94_00810, partial [ANME-2 cluster archaeon]
HGQNAQLIPYNESIHLTCERCHGKATAEKPLPLTKGNPGSIFLRLSYTYNNETQCNFCHQNRSNAYILHTNDTVDESNIDSINNDTICTTCHDPIPSITNISDRDELTADDAQREPYSPQILGHGNVSCYKCHGHRPETLTLTVGQNCVGCHQDPTELVELTPGSINKSSLSNVTNPGALQLIVISPQTTGHGNTSCAECHGHKNADMTSIGSDSASCLICHENTSSNVSLIEYRQPNSPRSNIIGQVGNTIYVTPPQVVGHGNASCTECHDHAPSSFKGTSLVGGTDCASCHQNTSTNVSLINGTVPASQNTEVVNNSTSVWIVHAPQVAGHGQADCSVCHSHNVENLVYIGETDNDCITCHKNTSAGTYLLQNGSYVVPPQVVPHNDLNCTECHGHTPNSMTHGYDVDCRTCHQNTTKAQVLTDTYGTGLNLASPAGNISAVQIPDLNHSTGMKWNKTAAYWLDDTEACQYCHKISINYSSHNPLGRVSVIEGTNQKNSTLNGSYWCAACHYENYSSGSVTFNDTVELYLEATLPVPPEVTANTTYGNYTYANDGLTKYFDHSLSDYSDEKCVGCHGESDNTKEFVHHVVGGFASCISCHSYGETNSVYRMNNTDMKLGVHANLNSNASNSTDVDADNKKCWGCHTSDGKEPTSDMGDKYTNPYTCMECHNGTVPYINVSSAPTVSEHFRSGENITVLASAANDTWSCLPCHNLTDMKVNYTEDDAFRSNISLVSHYAKNYTPLSSLRNYTNSTQYCIYCHDNDSSIFNTSGLISKTTNHGSNCSSCHGAGKIHDSNLSSFSGEGIADCLSCHETNNKPVNSTYFNQSIHVDLNNVAINTTYLTYNFTRACWLCHGNGAQPTTHLSDLNDVRTCDDAVYCHGNSTLGLNVSVEEHFINGSDIQATNATDNASSCIVCHNLTDMKVGGAPNGSSGLFSVSHYALNYTNISQYRSNINSTTYCLACHDNPTSIFNTSGLITKTTNHGTNCSACHGAGRIHDSSLSSFSGEGIADCINCHDYGETSFDHRINNSDMKLGVHANLNSNASNSTGVNADNKKCWGCHTSDGQEPTSDMGDKYNNPYICMECHNTTSKAYYNVSNAPAVYNHFGSGEQRLKQKGNDILSCMACHNKDEMKVTFSEDDSFRSNRSVVSHYAKNYTPLSSLRNYTNSTQYCIFCHDNESTIFYEFIDKKTNHGSNCSVCHGTGRIHDELSDGYTPSLPSTPGGNISGCLGCHADANSTISKIYLLNMTMFNDSVHYLRDGFNCLNCHISDDDHPSKEYKWKWCEDCHVVQNDPINDTDRHNVTNDPFNYTIGGVSVVNITDCTVCHDSTAYNASVEAYDTNKCRYCHEYADKGNKTSQSWY